MQRRTPIRSCSPAGLLDFFGISVGFQLGADAPLVETAELIKRTPGVPLVIEGTIDFARARAER